MPRLLLSPAEFVLHADLVLVLDLLQRFVTLLKLRRPVPSNSRLERQLSSFAPLALRFLSPPHITRTLELAPPLQLSIARVIDTNQLVVSLNRPLDQHVPRSSS